MKKLITILCNALLFSNSIAQVGIGNSNPRGALDINKPTTNDMGLVLPANSKVENIINPSGNSVAPGTVIYDLTLECIRVYKATNGWSKCLCECSSSTPTTNQTIDNLDCKSGAVTGSYISGVSSSGTKSVNYTGGNGSSYPPLTITSTGVTGLVATAPGGILANGNGSINLNISGTPSSSGNASFTVSVGGKTCTFLINVQDNIVPKRKILSLGDANTWYSTPAQGNTGTMTTILETSNNFGPNGIVKSNGFEIIHKGNVQNQINSLINQYDPYVIIIGWNYVFTPGDAAALDNYLKNGGRVMVNAQAEQSPIIFLDTIFGTATTQTFNIVAATGYIESLTNIDHPILSGPFGDVRSKFVGDDEAGSTVFSNPNINNNVDVLSLYNGHVLGFAHKKYKLFFWGDGGFARGMLNNTSSTNFPSTTDINGKPVAKLQYGINRSTSVNNSIVYANAIAWLIKN